MRLYNFDASPFSSRVRMAIYAKGLGDIEILPPPDGGTRSEAYRAINPLGKVPALVLDDGTVIPESDVILEYLEDRFPEPPLRPAEPLDRARMRLISRTCDLYVMPVMGRLFGQLDPRSRNADVVAPALGDLDAVLRTLDGFVGGDQFAIGQRLSLADCALVPMIFLVVRLAPMLDRAQPLDGAARLAAWWAGIQAEPAAARVLGELETGLQRMLARRTG